MRSSKVWLAQIFVWAVLMCGSTLGDEGAPSTPMFKGFRIIDHDPNHTGIDLKFFVGEAVTSPIDGVVQHIVANSTVTSKWRGLVINGTDDEDELHLRLLGIAAAVELGAPIKSGEFIGRIQDASKDFPGLRPYLHLEVYKNGARIDPTEWASENWPRRTIFYPRRGMGSRSVPWANLRLLSEAKRLENLEDYEGAVVTYEKALRWPDWEVTNTAIYRWIAQTYALLGRFDAAARAQETYLQSLRLELQFSEGALPDASLGTIAAVQTPESLRIYIERSPFS